MADEIDRKMMPELLRTTFSISLGACFKSLEMVKAPQESAGKIFTETVELFAIPLGAGEGLQRKAEAFASVWMKKSATLMEECKSAGEKFTEAK